MKRKTNFAAMQEKAASRNFFNRLKEVSLHFLLGGAALVLLFNSDNLIKGEWERVFSQWMFNGTLWVALGLGHGWIVGWLEKKMPWLEMPAKRLIVSIILSMGYTVVAAVVVFTAFVSIRYRVSLSKSFAALDTGFLLTVIIITIIVSLFLHGRGFFISWKESLLEAEKLKRAHLSAQYESLKNQVNPHFLFNSFNVLSSLVYKDPDLAAKFIRQLSSVYRYVLDTREAEVVPLSQELKILDSYLFLLKMRFGEALEVVVDVRPDDNVAVVPLVLQMLVENAVKHNVVSKSRPLHIQLSREGEEITIRNNFQPREDEKESLGIGLPNIQERYRYLTGLEVAIIRSGEHFTVRLPQIRLVQ